MRYQRFSCRRTLCETWFASFAVTALSLIRPIRKNISMIECCLVFSEVIAFVCIGSQCAAVRTLLPSHRGVSAEAGSTRADRVGEASISPLARPTSRRDADREWGVVCAPPKSSMAVRQSAEARSRLRPRSQFALHARRVALLPDRRIAAVFRCQVHSRSGIDADEPSKQAAR
jgi:hypothetical protein